jgi:DNA modification methylase
MSSTQSEPSGTRPSRPWPADQPERWPIERLIPYATNPRLHTEADIDKIAASIVEFGWTMPPLVDEKGMLIAGAARVAAAAKLKLASIPVIVASGWSKEQKRAYRLADNQLAARASWDFERLCNELRDLDFAGFDLDLIGFEPDQLETILAGLGSSGLTDPDSAPEVRDHPVTRRGDIWLLGDHRAGCGDSTSAADVAPVLAGSEPHLMIADPPYGVSYDPSWRARRGLGAGNLARGKVLNDDRADWREAYALFPGDVAYVWFGALHGDIVAADLAACGLQLRAQIVWTKQHFALGRGDYHWQHETCWYAVREGKISHWQGDRTQTTVWEISNNNPFGNPQREQSWGHGTQKPVECMRRPIVNNSRPGQAIYDPFLGSGTSLIAAEMTGRTCYGVELNPAYLDVAARRWQGFTGRAAMHQASGQSFDERADRQNHNQSGAAHGKKSICGE